MPKPIRFIVTDSSTTASDHTSVRPPLKNIQILFLSLGILVVVGLGLAIYQFRDLTASIIVAPNDDGLSSITQAKADKTAVPQVMKNRDRINILLIGIDRRPEETADITRGDSLMLVSIKPEDSSVVMISIPRDLDVEFPINSDEYIKINAVHNNPTLPDTLGAGPFALKEVVGKILGIRVHYFARVDFTGFIKIVDEIGGITVNVPARLYDVEYPNATYGYQRVDIPAGMQQMNGDIALKFARSRHANNPDYQSDENRASRQQQVLLAIKDKLQQQPLETLLNPQRITGILSILKDSFLTDIQVNEMIELAQIARSIDTTNDFKVIRKVLGEPLVSHDIPKPPNRPDWRIYPYDATWKEVHTWVTDLFENPFLRDNLQQESAWVGIRNATSTAGLARKTKEKLSGYPLNFAEIENAEAVALTTRIIDYSSGIKSNTLSFLEDYFDAHIEKADKIIPGQKAQIVVEIGEDYALRAQ